MGQIWPVGHRFDTPDLNQEHYVCPVAAAAQKTATYCFCWWFVKSTNHNQVVKDQVLVNWFIMFENN